MNAIIILIASYLIGSIPVAYIAGRYFKGIDIRKVGSGNVGATNVFRNLGPFPAVLVLIGDVAKGVVTVWWGGAVGGENIALLAGLAAIAGHNWSIFLGFRGGKGVATGLGLFLALSPKVAMIALAIFVVVVLVTRFVSLGSILGSASIPILFLVYDKPIAYFFVSLLVVVLVIYRHRANIQRLLSGTETKFGQK
ncbi:MAG: glycerol-3-phosphate 1-O-acyltransferase PlsY [Bacillota bacterium]